jgi:hypothetical protein
MVSLLHGDYPIRIPRARTAQVDCAMRAVINSRGSELRPVMARA